MIELEHIYFSFTKDAYTLSDVSLHIMAGEHVVLYGMDDSGKSSLLRIIAGLETPDSGTYFLRGRKIKRFNPKHDASLGYISSAGTFFEHKTVRENLDYVLRIRHISRDVRRAKVDKAIIEYNLAAVADKPCRDLDYFTRVVVSLARLSLRPLDIVLVDIKFGELSAKERDYVSHEIMRLVKLNNATSIVATNDDTLIKVLGDRYIKMEYGVAINE